MKKNIYPLLQNLPEKNKTKQNIVRKKMQEPNQLSGLYEIPFTKVDGTVKFYIGMTKKKLKTRKKPPYSRHQLPQEIYSYDQTTRQRTFTELFLKYQNEIA